MKQEIKSKKYQEAKMYIEMGINALRYILCGSALMFVLNIDPIKAVIVLIVMYIMGLNIEVSTVQKIDNKLK